MEEPGTQDNELDDQSLGDGLGDSPFEDSSFDDLGFDADDGALDLGSMDSMEPLDLEGIDLGDESAGDAGDSFDPGQPGDELSGDFDLDFPADPAPENAGADLDGGQAADGASPDAFEDTLDEVSFDEVPALSDEMSFDEFSDGSAADESLSLDLSDDGISEEGGVDASPADLEAEAAPMAADAEMPADVDGDEPVTGTSFFDETDDETVALSEDELEDILGNTDDAFFEDFGEAEEVAADSGAENAEDMNAALDTEDGRLELSDVRSGEELVPEPDLEPINPPDASDFGADDGSDELELSGDAPGELEELSFDDFDAPAASDESLSVGEESGLEVEAFSDEELELALELEDGTDDAEDAFGTEAIESDTLDDFGTEAEDESGSPVPGFLDEGDDDEPIALSEDELDNIMGDVEPAEAAPGESFIDESADDDMLSGMSDDISADFGEAGDDFSDELDLGAPDEEDENITLSDDELSQVLLDADSDEEGAGAEDAALDFESPVLEAAQDEDEDVPAAPSLSSLDMDDDEPIALTAEELGNIVSEVEVDEMVEVEGQEPDADDLDFLDPEDAGAAATGMFVEEDSDLDPSADSEEDFSPDLAGFDSAEEEGPVALSDSELGSILEDTDTETVAAEGQTPPEDDFAMSDAGGVGGLEGDEFADGNVIVLDEYEEGSDSEAGPVVEGPPEIADPELSPADAGESEKVPADAGESEKVPADAGESEKVPADDGIGAAGAAAAAAAGAAIGGLASRAEEIAADSNLDREELRTMISYLDGLFDALPDDAVRQFSQSSYFDLYKKIMTELGL
ncbi:MAG: hypothetical protein NXI24_18625 [bacterium]|nr:hypothetical protein [bacterium]